jgi:extracellular factor (EF) 3-hydroxypalmitic acid methyl ester biosynthesis protein
VSSFVAAVAPAVPPRPVDLTGTLDGGGRTWPVRIVGVTAYTLLVEFADGSSPSAGQQFDNMHLHDGGFELGRCSFMPHAKHPHRRRDDPPPEPGEGRLVFDSVYDFSSLAREGAVGDVQQKLQQLPLMWKRKEGIRAEFRQYTGDLLYDLQAFRLLLDDIDHNLQQEPMEVRARIRNHAIRIVYPDFATFFDNKLEELQQVVKDFSRQEHERHGFYFRKHVWDLILASPFLSRTNLKPRGYAGDSAMMHMCYEDGFRGGNLFAMCMHRHPLQTAAAQAVRNRRTLVAGTLAPRIRAHTGVRPLRVMSVACGPAAELGDIIQSPEDAAHVEFTLLDQDPEALSEALSSANVVAQRVRRELAVRTIRESVRTMLRTPDLGAAWGRFDFVYTMGLFDYLQPPVARVVLAKLYDLLSPGGELVVGNFHVGNPTRVYMEYWMDWVLVYRDEADFRELAAPLAGATSEVSFEGTRSQMFLHVRKK